MLRNKYTYFYLAIFSAGFISALIVTFFINSHKLVVNLEPGNSGNGIVIAKANNHPVYLEEIEDQLHKISPNLRFSSLNQEGKEMIIKKIAVEDLLLKKALKSKVQKESEARIKNFVANQVRQNYLQQAAQKQITESEIKQKYQSLVEQTKGKEEYRIRHILLKNRADADHALKMLYKDSFDNVAREVSIDKRSAARGGDLGYIIVDSMKEEVAENVKNLQVGKISKPFKSELGWHIIKLEDKRKATIAAYEDVKEAIREALIADQEKKIIEKLIKNIKVEIIEAKQ